MRAHNQIIVREHEIMDRHDRKFPTHAVPLIATIERDVDTSFGAGVEETSTIWVLAHYAGEVVIWNAIDDLRPRLAVIGGLEEIRSEIVRLVTRGSEEGSASIVRRCVDQADQCPIGKI